MTRSVISAVFSLLCTAVLMTANPAAAQSYTLTDLGASIGAYTANAINNSGQIAGAALPSGAAPNSDLSDPYLYSNGTITDLGNFGVASGSGQGYAINSLGQVVGLTGGGPFLFSNGTLSELSPTSVAPLGINTAGSIVGFYSFPGSGGGIADSDGFVIQNGALTDLGAGWAQGINTSGQIAGATVIPSTSLPEATLWQSDLTPALLGFLGTGIQSRAYAINDAGQAAGNSYTDPDNTHLHAFLFSNGTMTDIDTFNSSASWAWGINNNGVVVGMVADGLSDLGYDAFVYMGGEMMDLNTLIPAGSGLILEQANGINDAGQIVGTALDPIYALNHGVLLTPVAPEISAVSPRSGAKGTVVTIKGKNFSKKPVACTVAFNGVRATWTKWTDTEIQASVPAGATTGGVVVTAFFQKSNSKIFTVK